MKVAIVKSYVNKSEHYYNYGDDVCEVWARVNLIESVREVNLEELEVLKRALNFFNSKKNNAYKLDIIEIVDDSEVNSLLADFKKYEAAEALKVEKLKKEAVAKEAERKAKAEESKKARLVKKFAKELKLSEAEVQKMLNSK